MKIRSIETLTRGSQLAVVRVRTDDGVEGIGQTAPYEVQMSALALHSIVAPHFLGRDPWDVEALVDACLRATYKYPSTFILRAVAGVDTALWDILGKVTGQPVAKLIGGQARDFVPMYASSMSRSISPEAEGERLQALIAEQGFQAVKIRIGDAMGRDRDAAPGRTERIIPWMRQALGDAVDISADANGGYSAGRAIHYGRMLEEYGYFHFEEPTPFTEVDQLVRVSQKLDIPVSGGEQDNSLPQFHRLLSSGAVDIVQPDVGYIGGISRARKVAHLAEACGVPCTAHCANASLLQVFSLHLAVAMPAAWQRQEWSIEQDDWADGVYEPRLKVVDGRVPAPTKPGWGVELTPRFLKEASSQVSSV